MAKTGRSSDQVLLRLPDGLRDRVRAAAEDAGRSMNAEIVRVLEEAFPDRRSSASMAELPADLSVEELSRAVEAASRAAIEDTFRRLGVVRRSFPADEA